jgi:thiol-disulfide isomerase/thioredoxin
MKTLWLTAAALSLLLVGSAGLRPVLAGDDAPPKSDGDVAKGKDGAPNVLGKEVGTEVADIHLNFVLNDDGRTTVADYRGQVVIVDLWSTTCGPCRGLIPTFTKHQEELGKKGLQVFGITGEAQDVLCKFLATGNVAPIGYKMASGSSGGLLSPGTVPYSFLIGADGKVVWQGHGVASNKLIDAELKKVVPPTAEQLAERAQKAIDKAAEFVTAKLYLKANELLAKVAKEYAGTPAATTATAKLAEIAADKEATAELAAQTALKKILGGADYPVEKLSGKEAAAAVVAIDTLIKKQGAAAPTTAELAKYWSGLLAKDAK